MLVPRQQILLLATVMCLVSSSALAQSVTIAQDIARRFAVNYVLLPFRPLVCENTAPACQSVGGYGAASSPVLIAADFIPRSNGSKLAPQLLATDQAGLCIRPAEVVKNQVSDFEISDLGRAEYPLSRASGAVTLQELFGVELTHSEPSRLLLINLKKQGDFEGSNYKANVLSLCAGSKASRSPQLIVSNAIVGNVQLEFPLRSAAMVRELSASLLKSGFDELARTHNGIAYISRYYYIFGFSATRAR